MCKIELVPKHYFTIAYGNECQYVVVSKPCTLMTPEQVVAYTSIRHKTHRCVFVSKLRVFVWWNSLPS